MQQRTTEKDPWRVATPQQDKKTSWMVVAAAQTWLFLYKLLSPEATLKLSAGLAHKELVNLFMSQQQVKTVMII